MSRARIPTVIVARFHYRHQAELAHGYLNDAGVDSALFIDDAGGMDVGLAFVNPARLVVRAEDERRARAVLADVGMGEDGEEGEEDESEEAGEAEEGGGAEEAGKARR